MEIKQLIIWSVFVLFILIAAYRFRKILRLQLVGRIYGFYSYRYLNIYKRYFIRSPYHYCFRDDFIAHLLFIFSRREDIPSYKSRKDIYFENTPYLIKFHDFLKQKGKPYCFNAFNFSHLGFEIKALGYHEKVAGSKANIVFYFMNDSFFMGEYIFKKPRTDVKANLTEHYLGTKELIEDNFYIENSKDRIVHFQKTGLSIDIKYLNREDSSVIRNLTEYYKFITGKKLDVKS
jgi:hypothetical protein